MTKINIFWAIISGIIIILGLYGGWQTVFNTEDFLQKTIPGFKKIGKEAFRYKGCSYSFSIVIHKVRGVGIFLMCLAGLILGINKLIELMK